MVLYPMNEAYVFDHFHKSIDLNQWLCRYIDGILHRFDCYPIKKKQHVRVKFIYC